MNAVALYDKLYAEFGPQHWWPAASPFEVMVGAILTQNTSWKNVEKAVANLKKEKMLSVRKLSSARKSKIARLIRPSGYFNQKAERLQLFARHLAKRHGASVKRFFARDLPAIREELLALKGIGPETADSMLLYAGNKPVFMIDLYTQRIMERLGLHEDLSYHGLQDFFHASLRRDHRLFNEYHALLVKFAQEYCRKKPLCRECFLRRRCQYFK